MENTAIQELTAIQLAIEILETERDEQADEHTYMRFDAKIKELYNLLPKEREQIEEAYKTGYTEKEYLDYYPDKHPKEYFTTRYKQYDSK